MSDLDLDAIKGRLRTVDEAETALRSAESDHYLKMPYRIAEDTLHSCLRELSKSARSDIPALIAAYEAKCAEVERLLFFNEGIGKEVDELRAENERLRKIEDAARTYHSAAPGRPSMDGYANQGAVLDANPRPADGGE